MSPGAPSTPPAARPAPQLGPAQQAPSAAAPFEMRQPSSAPSTPPAAQPANPAQAAPPASMAAPSNIAPQRPAPVAPPQAQGGSTAPARPAALPTMGATAGRSVARIERPVLPFETIRLEGETDARSWTVHLTQDEAS